jgi:hypothetical protein
MQAANIYFNDFLKKLPPEHIMQEYKQPNTDLLALYITQLGASINILEHTDNENFKSWWSRKKKLICTGDKKDIVSTLGEIRAFNILYASFFGNNLICNLQEGTDFSTHLIIDNKLLITIEVYTPMGRASELRTTNRINKDMVEFAPFGMPEHDFDTNQSEVISKIAEIKQDEHQFKKDQVNILFIDFINPFLGRGGLNLIANQYKPYMKNENEFTCGALWHAFYAKKHDRIFEQLECEKILNKGEYKMPFNGRFQCQKSKIDFAVLNLVEGIIAYENFHIQLSDEIYISLLSLPNFNFDSSFLEWPINNLKDRVEYFRNVGMALQQKYKMPYCI